MIENPLTPEEIRQEAVQLYDKAMAILPDLTPLCHPYKNEVGRFPIRRKGDDFFHCNITIEAEGHLIASVDLPRRQSIEIFTKGDLIISPNPVIGYQDEEVYRFLFPGSDIQIPERNTRRAISKAWEFVNFLDTVKSMKAV